MVSQSVGIGTHKVDLHGLRGDTNGVRVVLSWKEWPGARAVDAVVRWSRDHRKTWQVLDTFSAPSSRDGKAALVSCDEIHWPGEDSGTRRFWDRRLVRATDIEVEITSRTPLFTEITVEPF